jgi:DNA polymerase-3 subunit alpha
MGYIKIIYDTVKLARDNNLYTGPGRGSAAGSLFVYLLGITCVDPIRHNLMF